MRIEATVYKRSIGFSKVYDFPLDEDELMEDVENQNEEFSVDYDLGEYVIDSMGGFECLLRDTIERYFDFEKYGRDIRLEGSAIDCDGKFLMGG